MIQLPIQQDEEGGIFAFLFVFLDKSLQEKRLLFHINPESKNITSNSRKFEFSKVTESFPISEVFRSHFFQSSAFFANAQCI